MKNKYFFENDFRQKIEKNNNVGKGVARKLGTGGQKFRPNFLT